MILFHGSLQIVKAPRILVPTRTLDYGPGFYTTTSEQQAREWVLNPPDEDWVDFVHANRTQRGFTHTHDLVYGPVANDRVYAAFALYEQGLLGKQELIAELKTYKLIDQMLFHTEKALRTLSFTQAKEVRL